MSNDDGNQDDMDVSDALDLLPSLSHPSVPSNNGAVSMTGSSTQANAAHGSSSAPAASQRGVKRNKTDGKVSPKPSARKRAKRSSTSSSIEDENNSVASSPSLLVSNKPGTPALSDNGSYVESFDPTDEPDKLVLTACTPPPPSSSSSGLPPLGAPTSATTPGGFGGGDGEAIGGTVMSAVSSSGAVAPVASFSTAASLNQQKAKVTLHAVVKALRDAVVNSGKTKELKSAFNLIRSELLTVPKVNADGTTFSSNGGLTGPAAVVSAGSTSSSHIHRVTTGEYTMVDDEVGLLTTSINSSSVAVSGAGAGGTVKASTAAIQPMRHWGNLISEYGYQPHQKLVVASVTIGRSSRCHIQIRDPILSSLVATISYNNGVSLLESCTGSVQLAINDQALMKGMKHVLRSGDRVKIKGAKMFAFIFQKLAVPVPPEVTTLAISKAGKSTPQESPIDKSKYSIKGAAPSNFDMVIEGEAAGEKVAVDDPSILMQLPLLVSAVNGSTDEPVLAAVEPPVTSESAASASVNRELQEKEKETAKERERELLERKAKFMDAFNNMITQPEEIDCSFSSFPYYICPDTKQMLISRVFPFLQCPAYAKYMEGLKSISRQLLLTGTPGMELCLEATVKALAKDMGARLLMLETTDDPTGELRPDNSAKQHLIYPPSLIPLAESVSSKELVADEDAMQVEKDNGDSPPVEDNIAGDNVGRMMVEDTDEDVPLGTNTKGTPSTEGKSFTTSKVAALKPLSIQQQQRQLNVQTSRVFPKDCRVKFVGTKKGSARTSKDLKDGGKEGLGGGGGDGSGGADFASVSPSFSPSFRPTPSSGGAASSSSLAWVTSNDSYGRGPMVGLKGSVLVTFDENSSRVGVRFDEHIPGGNSLGIPPLCKETHGYFVDTCDLSLFEENANRDSLEQLAIKALFDVCCPKPAESTTAATTSTTAATTSAAVTEASSSSGSEVSLPTNGAATTPATTAGSDKPIIVCIRDVNAVMTCNYERFDNFKEALQNVSESSRLIVIGLSTRYDHTPKTNSSGRNMRSHAGISFPGGILLSSKNINMGGDSGSHNASSLWNHLLDNGSMESTSVATSEDKMVNVLFPAVLDYPPPSSGESLKKWNEDLKRDKGIIQAERNWHCLQRVLRGSKLQLDSSVTSLDIFKRAPLSTSTMEKILVSACSSTLQTSFGSTVPGLGGVDTSTNKTQSSSTSGNIVTSPPLSVKQPSALIDPASSKLVISGTAMSQAVKIQHRLSEGSLKTDAQLKNIVTDNDFEKRILESCVIPASQLNVHFKDIGSLDKVKKTMEELIMLPLKRPELFRRGQLLNTTRGILLCGPPGTGKTMIAKAVACEAGANFINITASDITSKWFGEAEKCAKAMFTLAAKISPSVIFIDEIDAILTQRGSSDEHEGMRKIKNEIMASWDGLLSSSTDRIVVLGATNRPFDLDDAVLRRFDRRLLVDLPTLEQREQILKVILKDEELEAGFNVSEVASDNMTKGYSGSDLKSLCVAAAYYPVRDFLKQEKAAAGNIKAGDPLAAYDGAPDGGDLTSSVQDVKLRSLTMSDFKLALKEVSASSDGDSKAMQDIRKWVDTYGEGGSRSKRDLPYYM